MNILSVVLSITAFVCAFVPKYGAIISVILSIISVILALIKTKNNKNSEGEVIAVVLSIFAIIVCIIVNTVYYINDVKQKSVISVDIFEGLNEFNVNSDNINSGKFIMKVNNVDYEENEILVSFTLEALEDNSSFSIYDFALYGSDPSNYTVASIDDSNIKIKQTLNKGENTNITIKFNRGLYKDVNNYIIFKNSENAVKIKI